MESICMTDPLMSMEPAVHCSGHITPRIFLRIKFWPTANKLWPLTNRIYWFFSSFVFNQLCFQPTRSRPIMLSTNNVLIQFCFRPIPLSTESTIYYFFSSINIFSVNNLWFLYFFIQISFYIFHSHSGGCIYLIHFTFNS